MLHYVIATLHKIGSCSALRNLQLIHSILFLILLTAAGNRFIRKDNKKTPCHSFFQPDPTNQVIIIHQ